MSIEEEQFETFIPYNQQREYFFVGFKEYVRCPETNALDIIIVTYEDQDFELKWDYYDSYYRGHIVDSTLGKIHGFVV